MHALDIFNKIDLMSQFLEGENYYFIIVVIFINISSVIKVNFQVTLSWFVCRYSNSMLLACFCNIIFIIISITLTFPIH